MGAARPRRWKLPFHRALSSATGAGGSAPCSPSSRSSAGPASPARSEAWAAAEAAAPEEFLCPVSGLLMADPVILPSGRTFERACLRACADLAVVPPGVDPGGAETVIPNAALRAAIATWCARSGRAVPAPPSAEEARRAVLRAVPKAAAAAEAAKSSGRNDSVRRAAVLAAAASTSNSSSSPSPGESTSSYGSTSEITAAEDEIKEEASAPRRRTVKEAEPEPPAPEPADPLEDDVVGKVMDADDDGAAVAAAMGALREATREGADRRRALCTPRLLGALRRVLLLPRHAGARVDAAAALVNLSLEPGNKVRIVRAGAVPALVEVLRSGAPEAREHAAGALFGLALNEDNRAAIGVLGAVPPLLDLLTSPGAQAHHPARARRDAGMALYHLTLAAVNQSKVARFPGAPKALLAVASGAAEPAPIRRLALMVACNVAACAEGRNALMDAGAVASVSSILLSSSSSPEDGAGTAAGMEEWCVSAMYAMSRGSLRFRGLARAAGADRALRRVVADEACAGVRREMARKTLRAMRGDLDDEDLAAYGGGVGGGGEYNDLTGSSAECCGDGEDCGGSIVSDGLMSFRRRQRELGVSSCGNTAEF